MERKKMENEKCGNCRFFKVVRDHLGKCKRFPPSSIKYKGTVVALYPEAYKQDDGCGEWRAETEYFSELADTGRENDKPT